MARVKCIHTESGRVKMLPEALVNDSAWMQSNGWVKQEVKAPVKKAAAKKPAAKKTTTKKTASKSK